MDQVYAPIYLEGLDAYTSENLFEDMDQEDIEEMNSMIDLRRSNVVEELNWTVMFQTDIEEAF